MGIILASPLFSPQFLFWLVPFVLFLMASRQRVFALVAVATLSTIVLWNPAVPGWNLLVFARNTMLVLLAVMWTLDTARPPTDSREDVS